MKTLDDMKRDFATMPANASLGFRLIDAGDGRARVGMVADQRFCQEAGVVHGGVVSALADTAAAYALIGGARGGERMIGVEFKVNFLQSAVPGGEDLIAHGVVRKRGRTISVCEVDVAQGERTVATAVFTYMSRRAV